ncbi:unnamed protein product, partial [Ectocarpus sp. 8 AP-2014]
MQSKRSRAPDKGLACSFLIPLLGGCFSSFSPSRNGNAQRWLAWFDCPAKTPRKTRQSPRRLSERTPSVPTHRRLNPHFFATSYIPAANTPQPMGLTMQIIPAQLTSNDTRKQVRSAHNVPFQRPDRGACPTKTLLLGRNCPHPHPPPLTPDAEKTEPGSYYMIKEVRMTALVISSNWGFCCGEMPGRCLLALPGRCLLAVTARDHPDTPHQVLRLSPLVDERRSLRKQPWAAVAHGNLYHFAVLLDNNQFPPWRDENSFSFEEGIDGEHESPEIQTPRTFRRQTAPRFLSLLAAVLRNVYAVAAIRGS